MKKWAAPLVPTVMPTLALILALTLAPTRAPALELDCAAGALRDLSVAAEPLPAAPAPAAQEAITLVATRGATAHLLVRGPILGSMDAPDVAIALSCTRKGMLATATITRSANYRGALRQNQNWLPSISLALIPQRPEMLFQARWEMRLSTGAMLDRAKTPPAFPARRYPISLTKTIIAPSAPAAPVAPAASR